jgi:hypothetical protein
MPRDCNVFSLSCASQNTATSPSTLSLAKFLLEVLAHERQMYRRYGWHYIHYDNCFQLISGYSFYTLFCTHSHSTHFGFVSIRAHPTGRLSVPKKVLRSPHAQCVCCSLLPPPTPSVLPSALRVVCSVVEVIKFLCVLNTVLIFNVFSCSVEELCRTRVYLT